MTYGKSKERDMVRSILPSTSRRGARADKRNINKANRSAVRQALHSGRSAYEMDANYPNSEMLDDLVNFDASDVEIYDSDRHYARNIKYAMWDRRESDKVAPIIRWAEAKVADVRPEDRLSWLQARMPDNLAVRHAVSHIKFSDAFPDENPYEYGWRQSQRLTPEEPSWVRAAEYAKTYEDLYRICAGPLGRFNFTFPKFAYRNVRRGGYYERRYLKPEGPWEKVATKATLDPKYYDRTEVYRRPIERLQGVHHIEEFLTEVASINEISNREVQRAIDATLHWAYPDSYVDYDTKTAHGRKGKV